MKLKVSLLMVLIFFLNGCAILQPKKSINDPLIDFYREEPPKHTVASLKLAERAREYITEKKYQLAMHYLNRSLTIDPNNPFAYYFLAKIHTLKGENKKSLGLLVKAKHFFADLPFWKAQSYKLSGGNWKSLGNVKAMKIHYKKAREFDPEIDLGDLD